MLVDFADVIRNQVRPTRLRGVSYEMGIYLGEAKNDPGWLRRTKDIIKRRIAARKQKRAEKRYGRALSKGGREIDKKAVNRSTMYKHVVRAIHDSGKRRGYSFRKSPGRSSQEMARQQMINWGYAMSKTDRGGIPDRRLIKLTPKGKRRSSVHAREPKGMLAKKELDYQRIVARDLL